MLAGDRSQHPAGKDGFTQAVLTGGIEEPPTRKDSTIVLDARVRPNNEVWPQLADAPIGSAVIRERSKLVVLIDLTDKEQTTLRANEQARHRVRARHGSHEAGDLQGRGIDNEKAQRLVALSPREQHEEPLPGQVANGLEHDHIGKVGTLS